jgi:hypothetical protein
MRTCTGVNEDYPLRSAQGIYVAVEWARQAELHAAYDRQRLGDAHLVSTVYREPAQVKILDSFEGRGKET